MGLLRIGVVVYLFSYISTSWVVLALDHQSILHQIKSHNLSYCRPNGDDEGLLGSLDLAKVPQFGAMCNIPPPNVEQLKILLTSNVIPILCMGLYDVFQRFCKSVSYMPSMKEHFPITVEETKKLFDVIDKSESFSLHNFCSNTVKNSTISQYASMDAEVSVWWSELNDHIRNEKLCLGMCRTSEEDKVNPLCSYIIWFNSLYLSFDKDFNESRPKFEISVVNQESKSNSYLNKGLGLDSNQITRPSAMQNKSTLSSTISTVVSTSTTLQQRGEQGTQEEIPVFEANRNDKPQLRTFPSSSSQPTAYQNFQDSINSTIASLISSPNVTVNITNKTETVINHKPSSNNKNADETKVREQNGKTDNENMPSNPKTFYDVKIGDGYSSSVMTKTVNDTKKTPEKHPDGMVESDVSLEMTPGEMEMEQPSLTDKDLQQPYSDEELENGDGDDIDFEPEGSVKLGQNKTIPNKSKSSSATFNQGINDPDKAYGEEREILIEDHFIEAEDSHFFTYFLCMAVLTIMAYLAFHNKKKLLALALEGKRTRTSRRRPNSSNYSKLDCSLEEAMASGHTPASVTHVLY